MVDLAVKSTLEMRKPIFEQFPLRFGIYCNLVAAYLCVDPRGHADSIREALDYLGDDDERQDMTTRAYRRRAQTLLNR